MPKTLELETVNKCPICGDKRHKVLYRDVQDFYFRAVGGDWTILSCANCDSAYLSPRPSEATIKLAYDKYYTHASTSDHPFDRLSEIGRRYAKRRWLNEQVSQAGWWYYLYPVLHFREYSTAVNEYFRNLPGPGRNRNLLDVGCGNGEFLITAQLAGWQVTGTDFDAAAVAVCQDKGLNAVQDGLDSLVNRKLCFDQITLSHVIEHVYDPSALIANCYRLLKPGGRLWIETPNVDSRSHSLTGRYWRGLETPRHLMLFNQKSLTKLLKDSGFSRIANSGWRPMFTYLFELSQITAERHGEKKLNKFERTIIKLSAEAKNLVCSQRREFLTFQAFK